MAGLLALAGGMTGCGLARTPALDPGSNAAIRAQSAAAQAEAIDRAVERVTRRPATHDNTFQMWLDGPDSYGNLFAMIRAARRSIWVSTFEYHADAQGLAFTTLLGSKARQGLEIKVLVDQLGGSLEKDTAAFLDMLREAGAEVRRYPVQWHHGFLGINHRKLHIVDGEVAMTGGMNIGDPYFTSFHDTLATVRGGVVRDLSEEFYRDWVRAGGQAPPTLPAALPGANQVATRTELPDAPGPRSPGASQVGEQTGLSAANRTSSPGASPVATQADLSAATSTETRIPPSTRAPDVRMRVLVTSAPEKRHEIFDGLMAAIGAARDHINMAVPYFSEENLVEMLQDAARRGVKVRVMIPDLIPSKGIEVGNLFNRIHPGAARKLMASGAEVRLYTGAKLHLKVTEIDGAWVSYGSANGDAMSFLRNQELNLAIADPAVAEDVRLRLFEADLARSRPVTEADLRVPFFQRPIDAALEALSYYLGVKAPDLLPRAR